MTTDTTIRAYLEDALEGFAIDKPDSMYQRGYEAALQELYNDFFLFGPVKEIPVVTTEEVGNIIHVCFGKEG
jgi:hypothetical protein